MTMTREARHAALQDSLQAARARAPGIIPAIDYYGALIAELIDAPVHIEPPPLDAAGVARKLAAGWPVLPGESLGMDEGAIRDLLIRLCEATETFGKIPADINPRRLTWFQGYRSDRDPSYARGVAAAKIRQALADESLDFGALMGMLMGGHDADLSALAERSRLDGDLLATLARFAMRPTMGAFAGELAPLMAGALGAWGRGECPVCGSSPALGEYDDALAQRQMRCATCGASWPLALLRCAKCGREGEETQSLIAIEGDERHLVATCSACKHYVKGVRAAGPLTFDALPLEDLLTLSLDLEAQQQGLAKV